MYLHNHENFKDLIELTAKEQGINDPYLVEKDYWIMHCLYGLSNFGLDMELKGGTSLFQKLLMSFIAFQKILISKLSPRKIKSVLKSIQARTIISQNTKIVRRTILIGWPRN